MKKISLLIYEDAVLSAIAAVIDMLAAVNAYCRQKGNPPAFGLELVGEKMKNIQLDVPAQLICQRTMSEVTDTDLIIVPSFMSDSRTVLRKNAAIVEWIKKMKGQGAEIASLCVGSFFLAEAGLLKGKSATSHWASIDEMRARYPGIDVKPDLIITDQDGIYTSGGGFSSFKLVLYLIEKFCGRETAIWISRSLSVDMDQISQAHFAVFTGQHRHDDSEILKSQTYIEKNYSTDLKIDALATRVNTGKRNFIRRFKAATNNTPIEYLQRVRVEAAKKALESVDIPVDAVMDLTGYSDIKTFRMIFKRLTGLSPRDYRKKYSRVL